MSYNCCNYNDGIAAWGNNDEIRTGERYNSNTPLFVSYIQVNNSWYSVVAFVYQEAVCASASRVLS